jgi:NADH:ubiquinone oxidoreductase subunit 6 (subunit J)
MTILLISIVVYIIGVFVALMFIAWYNTHENEEELDKELAFGSWVMIFGWILLVILAVIFPHLEKAINITYDWFYKKFKK